MRRQFESADIRGRSPVNMWVCPVVCVSAAQSVGYRWINWDKAAISELLHTTVVGHHIVQLGHSSCLPCLRVVCISHARHFQHSIHSWEGCAWNNDDCIHAHCNDRRKERTTQHAHYITQTNVSPPTSIDNDPPPSAHSPINRRRKKGSIDAQDQTRSAAYRIHDEPKKQLRQQTRQGWTCGCTRHHSPAERGAGCCSVSCGRSRYVSLGCGIPACSPTASKLTCRCTCSLCFRQLVRRCALQRRSTKPPTLAWLSVSLASLF